MKEILFATHNKNKAKEISALLQNKYSILTLDDLDINEEIPETAKTLEGNALIKAKFLFEKYKKPCFADDTGLEVEALNGAPGVYTARYSGEDCNPDKNMQKLLLALDGVDNRRARFRTVIAYVDNGIVEYFEGIVEGEIAKSKRGTEGFGYDPIFIPKESNGLTFAEMGLAQKNLISHRARAIQKFITYLNNIQ